MADVASAASVRGHSVRVITANRGYDDPSTRFPSYERLRGVEILRLGWSSFGKRRLSSRIFGQICFTLQGIAKGLLGFRPDAVLVSTIPPLGILAAYITARLRRSALVYWVMDINPDEAIAMGLVDQGSVSAHLLELVNKAVLRSAGMVIALDPQMAKKLESKAVPRRPVEVIPPWPHEDIIRRSVAGGRDFRRAHGLEEKFIVMYSGNHSWVHPLDTVLEAASSIVHRPDIAFLFVGGGLEKHKVEKAITNGAPNVFSLPYQKFDDLGNHWLPQISIWSLWAMRWSESSTHVRSTAPWPRPVPYWPSPRTTHTSRKSWRRKKSALDAITEMWPGLSPGILCCWRI